MEGNGWAFVIRSINWILYFLWIFHLHNMEEAPSLTAVFICTNWHLWPSWVCDLISQIVLEWTHHSTCFKWWNHPWSAVVLSVEPLPKITSWWPVLSPLLINARLNKTLCFWQMKKSCRSFLFPLSVPSDFSQVSILRLSLLRKVPKFDYLHKVGIQKS